MTYCVLIRSIPSVLICLLLFSCKTNNDVATSKLIQKRKYQKGFYVNSYRKPKGKKEVVPGNVDTENNKIVNSLIVREDEGHKKDIVNSEILFSNEAVKVKSNKNSQLSLKEKRTLMASNLKLIHREKKRIRSIKKGINKKGIKNYVDEKEDDKSKIEAIGLVAAILSFIVLLFFIIPFIVEAGPLLLFGFLLYIPSFIMSVVSWNKVRASPESYRLKFFTYAALILQLLLLITLTIIIIAGISGSAGFI